MVNWIIRTPNKGAGRLTLSALALLLTLTCIISLAGCVTTKQTSASQAPATQLRTENSGPILGSVQGDQLVALDVPVDSYDMMYCHWSPDGQRLVYGNQGDLWLWNDQTGQSVNLTNTPDRWELMPAWSPDGTMLCFTSRQLDPREQSQRTPEGAWIMNGAWGGSPTIIRADGTGYQVLEEGTVWNVCHEGTGLANSSGPCLTEDEGRPLGAAVQAKAPNRRRLLWSKAMVVSACGKGEARPRQVCADGGE